MFILFFIHDSVLSKNRKFVFFLPLSRISEVNYPRIPHVLTFPITNHIFVYITHPSKQPPFISCLACFFLISTIFSNKLRKLLICLFNNITKFLSHCSICFPTLRTLNKVLYNRWWILHTLRWQLSTVKWISVLLTR